MKEIVERLDNHVDVLTLGDKWRLQLYDVAVVLGEGDQDCITPCVIVSAVSFAAIGAVAFAIAVLGPSLILR